MGEAGSPPCILLLRETANQSSQDLKGGSGENLRDLTYYREILGMRVIVNLIPLRIAGQNTVTREALIPRHESCSAVVPRGSAHTTSEPVLSQKRWMLAHYGMYRPSETALLDTSGTAA